MTPTLLTLFAALCPLPTLDWDYQAPCGHCGLPALDHEVLGERLVCPGTAEGQGETVTPEGREQ